MRGAAPARSRAPRPPPLTRRAAPPRPRSRIFAALVAGVAAGVAGVTGARGFLLFAASQLAVAAGVAARAGFAPRRFFPGGVSGLFSGLASQVELLTFVLFWTLAQNAVYLYG